MNEDAAAQAALSCLAEAGIRCRMIAIQNLGAVTISLPLSRTTPTLVASLKRTLASSPGERPVHLRLVNGNRTWLLELIDIKVNLTGTLTKWLRMLIGPSVVD